MQSVRRILKKLPQPVYGFLQSVYFSLRAAMLLLESSCRKIFGTILLCYVAVFHGKNEVIAGFDLPFFLEIIPFISVPFSGYMAWNRLCVWASSNSDTLIVFHFHMKEFHVRMEGLALLLENPDADERYVIVSSVSHDPVLERYNFDSGLQYYFLHFSHGDLIRFGGIKKESEEFLWYRKEDFASAMVDRKPRILQLPIIILYLPAAYTKGLRALGYDADYLIVRDGGYRWLLDGEEPDFDLEMVTENNIHRAIEALIYGLKRYDIFHIHSNCSFLFGADAIWEANSDISYLRQMGKVVISSTWGMCDDMKPGDESSFLGHSECNVCKKLRPFCCESEAHGKLIRRSEQYADLRLTHTRPLIVYPGKYRWIDNPVDINVYTPELAQKVPGRYRLPETKAIRIYHSFGNASGREDLKGTKFIREAVDRLQKEGYAIEFIFFHNLPHTYIKYYQAQADIVVDQLYYGWYGSTGTECLALGKPVISYVNPDVENLVKKMGREIPIISATPDTIYDVLKSLIDQPELRKGWGQRARKFAEDYHDYRKVAKVLTDYYEEVLTKRGTA